MNSKRFRFSNPHKHHEVEMKKWLIFVGNIERLTDLGPDKPVRDIGPVMLERVHRLDARWHWEAPRKHGGAVVGDTEPRR